MKKIMVITTALSLVLNAHSQQFKMNKIYAQLGTEATEIKSVFKNKWSITASTSLFEAATKLPSDYIALNREWDIIDIGLFIFSFGFYEPDNDLNPTNVRFSHIAFGRFYPVTRSISFTVDAGLGIATGEQYMYAKANPQNKIQNQYARYSKNYDITTKTVSGVGGIVKGGFDWAFSSFAGLGLDVYYNYNTGGFKGRSGLNAKLLIGWMNRPAKRKAR